MPSNQSVTHTLKCLFYGSFHFFLFFFSRRQKGLDLVQYALAGPVQKRLSSWVEKNEWWVGHWTQYRRTAAWVTRQATSECVAAKYGPLTRMTKTPFSQRCSVTVSPHKPRFQIPCSLTRNITIIFHLSKLWKAKFSILCDVIFLVRLRGILTLITLRSERVKLYYSRHIQYW